LFLSPYLCILHLFFSSSLAFYLPRPDFFLPLFIFVSSFHYSLFFRTGCFFLILHFSFLNFLIFSVFRFVFLSLSSISYFHTSNFQSFICLSLCLSYFILFRSILLFCYFLYSSIIPVVFLFMSCYFLYTLFCFCYAFLPSKFVFLLFFLSSFRSFCLSTLPSSTFSLSSLYGLPSDLCYLPFVRSIRVSFSPFFLYTSHFFFLPSSLLY
jgi:hypothetical protein